MAENFFISDKCTTCGCPDFHGDSPDTYQSGGDTWMKIHDQKISNSSKTFTFSADAVSTGSTYDAPEHLSRDGIFKITAYPVVTRPLATWYPAGQTFYGDPESWPDDCDWKSGGVTINNSFGRDQSGDAIDAPNFYTQAYREAGRRGQAISRETRVIKSWGWGFDQGAPKLYEQTGGPEEEFICHYRQSPTNNIYVNGSIGYSQLEMGDTRLRAYPNHHGSRGNLVGAIFVYLDKSKTIIGEIPDWLKTSKGYTSGVATYADHNDFRNGLNIRPHFHRHFIDWKAGDPITGQIDNIAAGSTTSGQDLTSTEWVVELWSLQTALPAEKYGAGGHYLITNDYPDKKITGIRWRRWTSSGITNTDIDLNTTTNPVGNWFWPLWTYDVDLPRSVGFTGCGNELLRFAEFEGGALGPSAPWGWFPEDEYYNPWPVYNTQYYAEAGGRKSDNFPVGPRQVGSVGNMSFGTNGSGPSITYYYASSREPANKSIMPAPYSAGGGGGLVRPNHLPETNPQGVNLNNRGGLWPLLTAQPIFDDGTFGEEMRMGAGFVGGIRGKKLKFYVGGSNSIVPDGYSGMGCNAHYPFRTNGLPWRGGGDNGTDEGVHQGYLYSGIGYATCWQIDFSPTHPENRKPDTYETCVRADGAFFHQDPLHPNFGCP
jgi:hypothetical protein